VKLTGEKSRLELQLIILISASRVKGYGTNYAKAPNMSASKFTVTRSAKISLPVSIISMAQKVANGRALPRRKNTPANS
jgi:hypothetical protein